MKKNQLSKLGYNEPQSRDFEIFWPRQKMTFKLKETWKQWFTKIEKHQRDNNKP